MKRFSLLVIVVALLASTASAQYRQRVSLSFGGGVAFPTDPADFSDNWKTGYGLMGEFEVPITDGEIALVATYRSNSFSFDTEEFRRTFLSSGQQPQTITRIDAPQATFWSLTGGGKLYGWDGAAYLRFDLGHFSLTRGAVSVAGPDTTVRVDFISKDGTLINLGAGLIMRVSDLFDVGLEADYYWAKSDKDESTGYVIIYSTGGSEIDRKNTYILNFKAVIRLKL